MTELRPRASRPYVFYDVAVGVCTTCLRRVEGKILFVDDTVVLEKWCPAHGRERVLVAEDVAYWRLARERFLKPSELPRRFHTPVRWGCPYDCGLCTDHQQHTCVAVVELTDHCNLRCPVCYAGSGPERRELRSMQEIEAMLDAVVRAEGAPVVVQLSGGEPTLHPELDAVIAAVRARPIRHLMINTNGLTLARDPELAHRLAAHQPGFEIYLQLDGLSDAIDHTLRGARVHELKLKALQHLEAADLSTTLVCTVAQGVNDHALGELIELGLRYRCVRGVTFQPVQRAGRTDGYDPARHRLTLTGVRRRILEQSPHFTAADIVPVPCHPDGLAMAYALRGPDGLVPLTRHVPPEVLLAGPENTITFEKLPTIRDHLVGLFSTGIGPEGQAAKLRDVLCCLPQVDVPGLSYRDVFRVLIVQFQDAADLDLRAVKKSCVHMARPDGSLIPFETYNLLYRDGLAERLGELRRAVEGA